MGNKVTDSDQLLDVGRKLFGSKFHGVYPSDQIPNLTKTRPYAILNLDTSTQFGSHWVSMAKQGRNIYMYDSFGRKSSKIIPAVFKGGQIILDAEYDAEQNDKQEDCGQRSLSWLFVFDQFGRDVAMKI